MPIYIGTCWYLVGDSKYFLFILLLVNSIMELPRPLRSHLASPDVGSRVWTYRIVSSFVGLVCWVSSQGKTGYT
jgi:hypothetical protein